jgi:hypothetical protein
MSDDLDFFHIKVRHQGESNLLPARCRDMGKVLLKKWNIFTTLKLNIKQQHDFMLRLFSDLDSKVNFEKLKFKIEYLMFRIRSLC